MPPVFCMFRILPGIRKQSLPVYAIAVGKSVRVSQSRFALVVWNALGLLYFLLWFVCLQFCPYVIFSSHFVFTLSLVFISLPLFLLLLLSACSFSPLSFPLLMSSLSPVFFSLSLFSLTYCILSLLYLPSRLSPVFILYKSLSPFLLFLPSLVLPLLCIPLALSHSQNTRRPTFIYSLVRSVSLFVSHV